MIFPFSLVSSHIAVYVGFVELGTILAPQTRQQTTSSRAKDCLEPLWYLRFYVTYSKFIKSCK